MADHDTDDAARQNDDELDLIELLQDLFRQKWIIVGTVILAFILGIIYLIFATRVYQVKSVVEPVSKAQLSALSIPAVQYTLKPEGAMDKLIKNLSSWQVRKAFYTQNKQLFAPITKNSSHPLASVAGFYDGSLKIHRAQSGGNISPEDRQTYIQFTYPAQVNGVAITNEFMQFAIHQTKQTVINDLHSTISRQTTSLRHKVATKRANYRGHLKHLAARLEKALDIARDLDIRHTNIPVGLTNIIVNNSLVKNHTTNPLEGNAGSGAGSQTAIPLYFMGSKVLESRLASVNARLDRLRNSARSTETVGGTRDNVFQSHPSDKYIDGIHPLLVKGRYLSSLKPSAEDFKLVQVTREAIPPGTLVKPNKLLVIAIALILGFIVGVGLALLRQAWKRHD